MKYNYAQFRMIGSQISALDNEVQQMFSVEDKTFICTLHFDTDTVSDTYNHWICRLELVSDTEDVPERSLVLYPNTLHFEGDDLFVVSITSELEEIGHDDLQNVFISIGVPVDE